MNFKNNFTLTDKVINIIGYSGHAYVVCDALLSNDLVVKGYFEMVEKTINPYDLNFLGNENDSKILHENKAIFIAVGDNLLRSKIYTQLSSVNHFLISAVHAKAYVAGNTNIGKGVLIAVNAVINPMVIIEDGAIINTGAIIEHESYIGAFAHIAPGAVLCGNVTIGKNSFIGANAVVKQGVTIGDNVIVGAGAVVIHDIESNTTFVGNPSKKIK
jgi:sugar O-acyltransferase (sialic acid O-acetyltransferase NeuD family)